MRKPQQNERKEVLAELARLADKLAAGRIERGAVCDLLAGPESARHPLQRWFSEARRDPAGRALASDLEEVLLLLVRAAGYPQSAPRDSQAVRTDGARLAVLVERLTKTTEGPISRDEANIRARAYLAEHATKRRVSTRELAEAIGCAVGLVPKLPVWIAYQEGLKAHAPAAAPRAVSLDRGGLV